LGGFFAFCTLLVALPLGVSRLFAGIRATVFAVQASPRTGATLEARRQIADASEKAKNQTARSEGKTEMPAQRQPTPASQTKKSANDSFNSL
jgi:hypothetical protein